VLVWAIFDWALTMGFALGLTKHALEFALALEFAALALGFALVLQ
jgi:hypothetical protein